DAVTQPGGRRPVREHVPEVGVAACAEGLDASHAEAAVRSLGYRIRHRRLVEAGPAAAGIVLGAAVEQQGTAAAAVVAPLLAVGLPVGTGEGPFSALLARDPVLLLAQQRPPFGVAAGNPVAHVSSSSPGQAPGL